MKDEKFARTETEKYFVDAKKMTRDYKEKLHEIEEELKAAKEGKWICN